MLTDERVLTAALTNRLHEVTLLLEAGKAMNAELELPAVIETILRSATDLLDANGGSVMLREDDDLVAVSVRGREEARGTRLKLGDGVAGPRGPPPRTAADRRSRRPARVPWSGRSRAVRRERDVGPDGPSRRGPRRAQRERRSRQRFHAVRPARARRVRRAGGERDHERAPLRGRARPRGRAACSCAPGGRPRDRARTPARAHRRGRPRPARRAAREPGGRGSGDDARLRRRARRSRGSRPSVPTRCCST